MYAIRKKLGELYGSVMIYGIRDMTEKGSRKYIKINLLKNYLNLLPIPIFCEQL